MFRFVIAVTLGAGLLQLREFATPVASKCHRATGQPRLRNLNQTGRQFAQTAPDRRASNNQSNCDTSKTKITVTFRDFGG